MRLRSLFSTFYSLMQPIATKTYTCIFPKVQNVGTKCLRTLYFTSPGYRRKYLSRHLLQRCRVWAEISAPASYLLMLDMRGNFRLHFFTIARCGQTFPSAFYLTMETIVSSPMQNVGANFRQHFPHKSKIQSNLYITALYIAVTLYIISHWATSQNFQLPYIFCKVDLYIVVTLYIMESKPIVELHAF